MNPAGAYGADHLHFQQEGADRTRSSVGAILFKKGASEIVPQLGRECQHVGQGRRSGATSVAAWAEWFPVGWRRYLGELDSRARRYRRG